MVSIGRTGKATPFAMLEPVVVGGANVSLATLHNEDQVRAKDVRPGDTVVVRRAGDVIPEVRGPVLPLRPPGLPPWTFPQECPVCDEPLVRLPGESDTFCVNVDCPGQQIQRISHFASRGAMDIEHLGERTVAQFTQVGLLHDVADIYDLDYERIASFEGWGTRRWLICGLLSRRRSRGHSPICSSAYRSATWAQPAACCWLASSGTWTAS